MFLFLALVQFLEPSEARKAFTNLAYTKFKNAPLYLEWAPDNSVTEKTQIAKEQMSEEVEKRDDDKVINAKHEILEEEIVEEPEPDTTIFVKNLNFQTTDNELRKVGFYNFYF